MFNGDSTTGLPRLEMSTNERLRLSTSRTNNETDDDNRTYNSSNSQFVELLHDRFYMHNNRVVNDSDPIDPKDVATKFYVDKLSLSERYEKIIKDHAPTF